MLPRTEDRMISPWRHEHAECCTYCVRFRYQLAVSQIISIYRQILRVRGPSVPVKYTVEGRRPRRVLCHACCVHSNVLQVLHQIQNICICTRFSCPCCIVHAFGDRLKVPEQSQVAPSLRLDFTLDKLIFTANT